MRTGRKQLAQRVVARWITGVRGAAARFVGLLGAAKGEVRGFERAAERAGVHRPNRDAEALDLHAEGTRLVTALVEEVALVRAVLKTLHARVVLAEVR